MQTKGRGVLALFLDILFPPRCCVCGEVTPLNTVLCPGCIEGLPEEHSARIQCAICGKPQESCVCRDEEFYFLWCLSSITYNSKTHQLFNLLKMQPESPSAKQLAALMVRTLERKATIFDGITAVPMNRKDFEKRGHNQAQTLAVLLSQKLNVPYIPPPIMQVDEKRTQHTLPFGERLKNAEQSYQPCAGESCRGRILLVDDIMTTGATLNRCAHLLRQCGATEVCCLTAATTPRWKTQAEQLTGTTEN